MLLFVAADPHHGLGLKKFLEKESGWTILYPYPENTNPPLDKGFFPIPVPVGESINTAYLLRHPFVQTLIKNHLRITLVVFKNSQEIQDLVATFPNVTLASSPPLIAQQIEHKLHAIRFLDGLPTTPVMSLSSDDLKKAFARWGEPIVVQHPRSHAGNGTSLLFRNDPLSEKNKRLLKVSPYWPGDTYTLNACVSHEEVWISFPMKQLTGMAGLTPYALGSCGNDIDIEEDVSLKKYSLEMQQLAYWISKRMQQKKYLGVFGIDFLIPFGKRQPYVLEINPRLTGNIGFTGLLGCDILLKHLQVFDWEPLFPVKLPKTITGGAQLIFRQLNQEKVRAEVMSGVYRFHEGNFEWVSATLDLDGLRDDEYLILFRRQEELFRIQKNRPLRCWHTTAEIFQATQAFLEKTNVPNSFKLEASLENA